MRERTPPEPKRKGGEPVEIVRLTSLSSTAG